MPELPDVENFRRYLQSHALRRRIIDIEVRDDRILHRITAAHLKRALRGRSFERARRHGKHLFAALDDGNWLTMHFGMTGRLAFFKRSEDDPKLDRLRFDFEDGSHLAFVDQRLLGEIGMIEDPDTFIAAEGLGPDAIDPKFGEAAFVALMASRKGQIKPALMDQHLLAGIGNIYSDEILFQARLHPAMPVPDASPAQLKALYRAIRNVLKVAIDKGAGSEELTERLPPSYLLRHREKGARCPRCGGPIATVKFSGRTTYLCPRCQPKP